LRNCLLGNGNDRESQARYGAKCSQETSESSIACDKPSGAKAHLS